MKNGSSRSTFLWLCWSTVLVLLCGCSHVHIDAVERFRTKGKVVEMCEYKPIGGALITFIDTGFDNVRTEEQKRRSIGTTKEDGSFDIWFVYWWAFARGGSHPMLAETFEIVIEKGGYKEKRFSLSLREPSPSPGIKVSRLPNEVDLGVVKMEDLLARPGAYTEAPWGTLGDVVD